MASYDQMSSLRAAMIDVFNKTDPDTILRNARGVAAETFDTNRNGVSTILISGTTYLSGLPLLGGTVITNLSVQITVAGAAVSLSKVGLYNTSGTLLASSADQGSSWNTAGYKTIALTAPYTVPATGVYYGGIVFVTASTAPTFARGQAPTAIQGLLGCVSVNGGILPYASVTGQTDLVSVTVGAGTAPGNIWMAAT